jgi:ActR/RegA family two-component response regulator
VQSWFECKRPINSVLFLDDDAADREACEREVRPRCVFATSAIRSAFDIARAHKPDLALVDLWLGPQADWCEGRRDAFGIDVISELHREFPEMILVLVSCGSCTPYHEAARQAGAEGAVPKHLGFAKIMMIVEADQVWPTRPRPEPSLEMVEFETIADRYLKSGRNATKAAKSLDIKRDTLYRRLRGRVPKK